MTSPPGWRPARPTTVDRAPVEVAPRRPRRSGGGSRSVPIALAALVVALVGGLCAALAPTLWGPTLLVQVLVVAGAAAFVPPRAVAVLGLATLVGMIAVAEVRSVDSAAPMVVVAAVLVPVVLLTSASRATRARRSAPEGGAVVDYVDIVGRMGAMTLLLDAGPDGGGPVVAEVHDGLGWGTGGLVGRSFADAFPGLAAVTGPDPATGGPPGPTRLAGPAAVTDGNGAARTVEIEMFAIPGEALVMLVNDVTERQRALDVVRHQADHDVLTGLLNRRALLEAADGVIAGGRGACLAVLDLNGFKDVNDTLGHPAGDHYLIAIARRLTNVVGGAGSVARLGGDEFAILVPGSDRARTDDIVRAVVEACREPVSVRGISLASSASVGLARQPEHGTCAEELLRNADVAMYRAKRDRSGPMVYDPTMDRPADGMELLAQVPSALADGRFRMHYQPKVEPLTEAVVGFEALVRWDHPDRGLLAPEEFLDLLLVAGYTDHLASWALSDAVRELTNLPPRIGVSVNLTAPDVRHAELPERCRQMLAAAGVAPGRLTIEITESHVLDPTGVVAGVLEELTAVGVRVAVDDFGTGYSSLSHLRALPLSELKIDRSFVLGMRSGLSEATIVRSVIELGHNLGLGVTAEGVEDAMTARRLTDMGVDTLQGYLYGHPEPDPGRLFRDRDAGSEEGDDAPTGAVPRL